MFHRDRELAEEIQAHLNMAIKDRIARGQSPAEAERDAVREFGNVLQVKEVTRETWGWVAVEALLQDLRYGLRMLGKSRGLTATVTLTLALGIGANTAIFSLLNGWLLRPLPVQAPEQLVVLSSPISYPDFVDFQSGTNAFSDVFAWRFGIAGMSAGGQASLFAYSAVTGNYFSALGVKPTLGRLFLPGENEKSGEQLLAVLGYAYWQRRFGGAPGVIGQKIRVNGRLATIIGVTPPEFRGTFFSATMDGYLTLNAMSFEENLNVFRTDRGDKRLTVFARLKPGVSLRQAQSSVDVINRRLAAQYPAENGGAVIRVIPEKFARPAPAVASFVPVIASLFLLLPGLLLLLACVNVANLLLARAMARQREMAIRAAVGGGRVRLIRQVLTEGLLLALLGGVAGVVLGEAAIRAGGWMLRPVLTNSSGYSLGVDTSFDWRVFAYAISAAILTGIFVAVGPAFRATRANVNVLLHAEGRTDSGFTGGGALRKALVVAQVAGSLLLLIVSGLFIRSLGQAEHMYLGFDPDHVLTMMLDPRQIGYDESRTKTFYRELIDRVRALPGVQSASLSFTVPMTYGSKSEAVHFEGHPLAPNRQPPVISFNSIGPAYFQTMRVPLIGGRNFRNSDNETAPRVAIVNRTMARKFWQGEDAIGKRFKLKNLNAPYVEVVGIAQDGQYNHLSPEAQAYFYVPLAQSSSSSRWLQVRSTLPEDSLIAGVEQQIRTLAPDLPVTNVGPMRQIVQGLAGLFFFRLAAALAAILGILGLILAVIGVYGVVSFSVSQRTSEIGIRMALGADRRDILKLVSRQGLRLVLFGVAAGVVAAWGFTRALTRLLVGISPADPATYGVVAIALAAVAFLACWVPARRALRVDPIVALRYE